LVLAALAAIVVCALKVLSGPRLAGGSAFVSGLRAGGPLIGCLGGIYVATLIMLGVTNIQVTPTLKMVAPGIAEALLIVGLGLTSGVIAVICHWIIDARIDRAALRP
jgi:biopolymer transport protein ExbB/TolQ